MAVSREELKEALGKLPVLELVELISELEEEWGVSAAAPVAVAAAPAAGAGAAEEEQTEFDVVMSSFGEKKVAVIKVVRALTSMGLKEAKELVDNVPSKVREGVSKEDAENIKKQLEEVGAVVDIT